MKRKNFARRAQQRREDALSRLLASKYQEYEGEQTLEQWQARKEEEAETLRNKIK